MQETTEKLLRARVYDGSGKTVELLLTQEEFDTAKRRADELQEVSMPEIPEWVCIEPVTGVKA